MNRFGVGLFGALLLASSTAFADEGPNKPVASSAGRASAPVWIGAMCMPADATLRSQLSLADGVGLIVAKIMPDSPADKAGLRIHDIVVSIDGVPTGDVVSLMAAVEKAGEQGLKFDVIRVGKRQTITVVPAQRPQADMLIRPGLTIPGMVHFPAGGQLPAGAQSIDAQQREEYFRRLQAQVDQLRNRLQEADAKLLQDWLDRQRRGENQPLRLQLFGPGFVMQNNPQLPPGVNVTIVRNGAAPTRITVTRTTEAGLQRWDIDETEIDKLPEELRETIRAMVTPEKK